MKRWLTIPTILLFTTLLLGATPLPIILEPTTPTFGKVVTVIITLPDDVVPSGLPALGPLAPLAAPTVQNNEYRLELLPLRSGTFTLPSLPFKRGYGEHFRTEPLTIEVIDDIPLDAIIIPPPKPQRSTTAFGSIIQLSLILLIIATGSMILLYAKRRRVSVLTPPPLSSYSGDDLLAELHRRIMADSELTLEDRDNWRSQLDAARFSQPKIRDTAARQLLTTYLQKSDGEG